MNLSSFPLKLLLGLTLVTAVAVACGGGDGDGGDSGGGNGDGPEETPGPFAQPSEVVTPAANVDAMEFAPDGRLFYVEHWTGNIRIVSAEGELLEEPFAHVDVPLSVALGLTGLALDPDFETNGYVYILYSQLLSEGPPAESKPALARFTDEDNTGTEMTVLIDDLPEVNPERSFNVNGTLHFGPDGFLYFTLGDYDQAQEIGPNGQPLPQDLGSPVGKMLRVNKEDGSASADNPFVGDPSADPRIYAYGFRGAFNFVFHPETGVLYGSDNSGSICEEINIIEPGGNYGWTQATETPFSDCPTLPGTPAIHFPRAEPGLSPESLGSSVGVSGMEFISGDDYPALGDSLVFCESGTERLRRVVLAPPSFDRVTADDVISLDCWLDVTVGPDGLVYYANLTEIRRLTPATPSSAQQLIRSNAALRTASRDLDDRASRS
jgi:glucose/arabinose dehydrogenase